MRDIIVLITACSWLLFFMTVLRDMKCGKVLGFISTISFELYLVHHPFVLGDLSWLNSGTLTENIWINGFLAVIVVFVAAFILNKVGKLTAKTIG
jgi:peptidoglycan/LPS O-acetylase OafA/YrhL